MSQQSVKMLADNFSAGLRALAALNNNQGRICLLAHEKASSDQERAEALKQLAISFGIIDPKTLKANDAIKDDFYNFPVSILANPQSFEQYSKGDKEKQKRYYAVWGVIVFAYLRRCTTVSISELSDGSVELIGDLMNVLSDVITSGKPKALSGTDATMFDNVSKALQHFRVSFDIDADEFDAYDLDEILDDIDIPEGVDLQTTKEIWGEMTEAAFKSLLDVIRKAKSKDTTLDFDDLEFKKQRQLLTAFELNEFSAPVSEVFQQVYSNSRNAIVILDVTRGLLCYMLARVKGFLTGKNSKGASVSTPVFKFDPSETLLDVYKQIADLRYEINFGKVPVDTEVGSSTSDQKPNRRGKGKGKGNELWSSNEGLRTFSSKTSAGGSGEESSNVFVVVGGLAAASALGLFLFHKFSSKK